MIELYASTYTQFIIIHRRKLLVKGKNNGNVGIGGRYRCYREGFLDEQILEEFTEVKVPLANNEFIIRFTFSYFHAHILTNDGRLLGCGYNKYGQLGTDDYLNNPEGGIANGEFIPIKPRLDFGESITDLSGNGKATIILTNKKRILSCGDNENFNLGQEAPYVVPAFTPIESAQNILSPEDEFKSVSLGVLQTIILSKKGDVFSFGHNHKGQCGTPGEAIVKKVTRVDMENLLETSDYIAHVFACRQNTFLLTSKNIILVCGINHWAKRGFLSGQLIIEKFTKLPKSVFGVDHRFKLINISNTNLPIFVFTIKNKVVFSYPNQDSGDGVFPQCKSLYFPNGEYAMDIVIDAGYNESYALLFTSKNRIIKLKFNVWGDVSSKTVGFVLIPTLKMKMVMPTEKGPTAPPSLGEAASTDTGGYPVRSFKDLSSELGHLILNDFEYAELLQLRKVCRWFRDTIDSIFIPPIFLPPQQSSLTFLGVLNNIMSIAKSSALENNNLRREIGHLYPSDLAKSKASTFIPAQPEHGIWRKHVDLEQVLKRMLNKRTDLTRRAQQQPSFSDASIRDPLREINNVFWHARQLLRLLNNHPEKNTSSNAFVKKVLILDSQVCALEKALS